MLIVGKTTVDYCPHPEVLYLVVMWANTKQLGLSFNTPCCSARPGVLVPADYADFAKKLRESAATSNSVVLAAAHSLHSLAAGLPPSALFSDAATRKTVEELGVKYFRLGPEYLQLYFRVLFGTGHK